MTRRHPRRPALAQATPWRAVARAVGSRVLADVEGPDRVPLAWTLRGYTRTRLGPDTIAGLTVAALIVPLSIGYAGVAGLPPQMGLYASVAPLLAYAVFGSGRRLIVGPDAATAALIAATIAPLAATPDERVVLAGALGLLVAAIFVGMRLAKMGFLADLLSRPILVGYMAGVGITVVVGQVPKILGGPAFEAAQAALRSSDWAGSDAGVVLDGVRAAVAGSGADPVSLAIGGGVILAMVLGRRFVPRLPVALLAMVVTLLLSWGLHLEERGVAVLGTVPGGLPPLGVPVAGLTDLLGLLPGAIGLAMLSFADTSATGRSFAARAGERTDANRELVALAAADAAGALTGGYPVSSSPSRTAAAEGAGATSQMAGVVAAIAVCVVLLVLTGPLSYLPMPALGGVILVSVIGLVDVPQLRSIWQLKKSEGAIALAAMAGVVLYGTLPGVAIATLLAALNVVRRAAAPPITEEVRLPDGRWGDSTRRPDGVRVYGALVVRFAAPLFFANGTALATRTRELVAARPDAGLVVLDLGATPSVDLTAAGTLAEIDRELRREGRQLAVARALGHVRDDLRAFGLASLMATPDAGRGTVDEVIAGHGWDPATLLDETTNQPMPVAESVTAPRRRRRTTKE